MAEGTAQLHLNRQEAQANALGLRFTDSVPASRQDRIRLLFKRRYHTHDCRKSEYYPVYLQDAASPMKNLPGLYRAGFGPRLTFSE